MKRYDLELTATGPVMEERKEGAFVPFAEVEQLQAKVYGLLEERNSTGIAINNAIRSGILPDKHPLRSRLELLANHHKRERALADGMVAMTGRCNLLADLLREVTQIVPAIGVAIDDLPVVDAFLERIEAALSGQAKGRTITEGQELELTTVLQSIANGFSDDPAHDAAALLKRIAGEVPWTGDSFQLPPRQAELSCNQHSSLTGQVFAGLSAAATLSALDKSSVSDVVQLMLEAAEAKGGEPCDSASPSSSPV